MRPGKQSRAQDGGLLLKIWDWHPLDSIVVVLDRQQKCHRKKYVVFFFISVSFQITVFERSQEQTQWIDAAALSKSL